MSSQSTADRIAKAQAQAHRVELFARLRDHGQNVQILAKVPTEGLEGMLAGLDAAAASVAQAQAQAKASKASTRLTDDTKTARRIRRTLSLNPDGTFTKSQMLAFRVAMNPACEKEKGWNLSNYRDMLSVLMAHGLLSDDYRNRLINAMNTGRI